MFSTKVNSFRIFFKGNEVQNTLGFCTKADVMKWYNHAELTA